MRPICCPFIHQFFQIHRSFFPRVLLLLDLSLIRCFYSDTVRSQESIGGRPMAKKKSAGGLKMAEEIRTVLGEHPGFALKEAKEAIETKHPGAKINDNSFSVAFYAARKKLGIGSSRNGRG